MTSSFAREAALTASVRAALCALCLLVTGCAFSPWAVPPETISKPFSSKVKPADGSPTLTMSVVAAGLDQYLEDIRSVRRNKDGWSSGFSDTTFAGAMAAVAGGIASRTALINIGAGVAAAGLATDQHYATEKQSDAYTKAEQRLVCIQGYVVPITDALVETALGSTDDSDVMDAALHAPHTVIEAVDSVRADLLRELSGLRSAPPSPTDLGNFFKQYTAVHGEEVQLNQVQQSLIADKNPANRANAKLLAQLGLVKTFPTDVAACLKTIN
jgi:hypothetical protein